MRVTATGTTLDQSTAELLAMHRAALLAYVRSLVDGDSATADDVVQETMIRAWQHPEAFLPGRGSARGWLFTVARNLAMDSHRRRTRLAETAGPITDTVGVSDWIEKVLDRQVIGAALDELSPEHRDAVVEVYLNGLPVQDAARRLGVPTGTVKSRAFYGLRNLRQVLDRRGLPRTA